MQSFWSCPEQGAARTGPDTNRIGRKARDDGLERGKTNPKLDTVAHFSRSLGISIDALVGIVPKGDVPSCVRTFFAGMSAEEAAKYIRLCKDADELAKK